MHLAPTPSLYIVLSRLNRNKTTAALAVYCNLKKEYIDSYLHSLSWLNSHEFYCELENIFHISIGAGNLQPISKPLYKSEALMKGTLELHEQELNGGYILGVFWGQHGRNSLKQHFRCASPLSTPDNTEGLWWRGGFSYSRFISLRIGGGNFYLSWGRDWTLEEGLGWEGPGWEGEAVFWWGSLIVAFVVSTGRLCFSTCTRPQHNNFVFQVVIPFF